ncbi:Bifunctional inhibitor/plant lipid transfer protein/seed storage helical domain containing protein [Trema orientale]|uniref:Bifunctional inhibitor/plant lipid transfer protein/seed storage helical domain containing protein n=1 Tax=Trema orientale TaxID=63057 RepID=A0A2P5BKA3_TREOI|nr:Bifunctional inhibitor/plant lipid transfer protein/seed storage helical domain containing protein [Trema orientale]
MKKFSIFALSAALVVAAGVLLSEAPTAEAVTCSPLQLSSCLSAITGGTPPSSQCCAKLNEQKPCLCGYLKDPNFRQYVNSPNAKKVAAKCGVSYPKCS